MGGGVDCRCRSRVLFKGVIEMKIARTRLAFCLSTLISSSLLGGCGGHSADEHKDLGIGGVDMATQADMAGADMAEANRDMAMQMGDMSTGVPVDMAQGPDLSMNIPADMAAPLDMAVSAQVRFINAGSARTAGADAGKLYGFDVYLAGGTTPLVTAVNFGKSSSWTSLVPAAGVKFDLRYAGDAPTTAPLFTTADADALDLSNGGKVSVVIYGISKTTTGGFKLLNVSEGFTTTPKSAAARFVNVSPAASTYKVYLDPNGAPTLQVAANSASPAAGVALSAGADLPVLITNGTSSSTMFPASTDATWTLPAATVADGKQLLLIVTGQGLVHPRDPSAVVLLVIDEQANAQVLKQDPLLFVVDAAPTAPSIDVQTDASKVTLPGFAYKTMKHMSLPAGAGVTMKGSSAGAPLFASPTGALVAGERYLGLIAGASDATDPAAALQLRVYQEQFAAAATAMARVRAVNESPTAPALDIGIYYTTAFTPILTMLPFPNASDAAGAQTTAKSSSMTTMSFGVGASGDATSLLPFSYVSQFDPDDPLFVIPAGDWSAAAASTAKKVIFVKAPIKTAWQVSGN
jgi:hypothetical protein